MAKKELNLNVLLEAVDKVTGPLKRIQGISKRTAEALKSDRRELKNLNRAQKEFGQFKALRRGAEQTQQALAAQEQEVARLTRAIKGAGGSTKRLNQQRNAAIQRARKLKREYGEQQSKLQNLRNSISQVAGATGSWSERERRLQQRIEQTNKRIQRRQNALQRLGQADLGGRFARMTGEVRRFGRRATFALGAAGAGIFGLAKSAADLGDSVSLLAEQLGMDVEKLQEYRYAAGLAGISTQKFDSNIERFVKRLGEAANETGAAAPAFEALGLDAAALADMLPGEALEHVADALANVDNKTRRVALAAKFFGRRGVAMLNMIENGSESLRTMGAEAQRTGYVLDHDAARAAAAFSAKMHETQMTLAGVKNTIGVALLPAVTELMGKLSHWLQTNHEQVVAFARTFGDNLKRAVPIIRDLASGMYRAARTMAGWIGTVAELVGGFKNLGLLVAALFAAKMIAAIVSFGSGLVTAAGAVLSLAGALPLVGTALKGIGAALAANPIGITIMAIAGAAFLIYKYWEPIKAFFTGLWDKIKQAFAAARDAINNVITHWRPLALIKSVLLGGLGKLTHELVDKFKSLGSSIVGGIASGIKGAAGTAKNAVTNVASGTAGWFADKLGIRSPSRVFRDFGLHTIEGYRQGLQRGQRRLRHQLDTLGGAIAPGPALTFDRRAPATAPAAAGGASVSVNFSGDINISSREEASMFMHQVESAVERALANAERQRAARARSALFDRE